MKIGADKLRNSIQYGLGVMDSGSGEFKELSNKIDELFELSYLEGQSSPKIKQLEWKNRFESASEFGIKAQTPFCTYTLINMEGTRVAKGIHLSSMDDVDAEVSSYEEGKKLAQEDFERRVLQCLITE